MTVCIAAIADSSMIGGMSDRMLTAGDVQFQPSASKIWRLTNSIAMMVSGDIGTQSEIYADVLTQVHHTLGPSPSHWLRVETVVELYRQAYFRLQRRRAEQEILAPLGLDSESFLARQASMDAGFVSNIGSELINFRMPEISSIIAGVDPALSWDKESKLIAPHIYSIHDGRVSCADAVGFACIGAGAWHANSTLMLAGHTPGTPASTTLLTVYSAKKRAEVAPGVGPETDTFVITGLGGYSELRDEIRDAVTKAYDINLRETRRSLARAEQSLNVHIQQIINPPKPAPESQAADGNLQGSPVDRSANQPQTPAG
jgi:hypothetical protein